MPQSHSVTHRGYKKWKRASECCFRKSPFLGFDLMHDNNAHYDHIIYCQHCCCFANILYVHQWKISDLNPRALVQSIVPQVVAIRALSTN